MRNVRTLLKPTERRHFKPKESRQTLSRDLPPVIPDSRRFGLSPARGHVTAKQMKKCLTAQPSFTPNRTDSIPGRAWSLELSRYGDNSQKI